MISVGDFTKPKRNITPTPSHPFRYVQITWSKHSSDLGWSYIRGPPVPETHMSSHGMGVVNRGMDHISLRLTYLPSRVFRSPLCLSFWHPWKKWFLRVFNNYEIWLWIQRIIFLRYIQGSLKWIRICPSLFTTITRSSSLQYFLFLLSSSEFFVLSKSLRCTCTCFKVNNKFIKP